MDRETIENHIKNLGKRDFDALVGVILAKFFGLTAIDVDGKGDGGSDYRAFRDDQGNHTVAFQRTVQDAQWESKAVKDAESAENKLGASRYFFITSRAHAPTALIALQNRISATVMISATCLGATELAGIIISQGLLREFAEAIGLQLNIAVNERLDNAEILLHGYIALGSDRADLKQEVYEDTLLLTLHATPHGLDRKSLVHNASELLSASAVVEDRLASRIDSLLTRGFIRKTGENVLILDDKKRLELAVADGVYQKELQSMAGAQAQVLKDLCELEWDADQCMKAATLLSRWFIQRQLVSTEHASVPVARVGLSRAVGNPEHGLHNLLAAAGVPPGTVASVLDEFVRLASDSVLVKKLATAVTYVATEGTEPVKASRVLGATSWSEVICTLDTSVAIPYMCACLFRPTQGRFSQGATTCLRQLREENTRLVMPGVYLNELSAHLLSALKYPEVPEFTASLEHSQNGFVAYYYQLKAAGRPVPESLRDFVAQFASAALKPRANFWETVRSVMAQLQPLLHNYGVEYDDISRVPEHFRKDVEINYAFYLKELKRTKSQRLIEHDVHVVGHARRARSERGEIRMCLTWDAAMIAMGLEMKDCGWIVSPHEASDIVRPRLKISDSRLSALAHSLARVRERPSELAARIIDRVVQSASEQLQDWQFRERLTQFQDEVLKRIDLSSESYSDLDQQIDKFLESEGIAIKQLDFDVSEE